MSPFSVAPFGVAPALALALLHSLWQDVLLALAAALTLAAMARASAAWRHSVAMAFLVAMVLVPAVQFLQFWQRPAEQINFGWPSAWTASRLGSAPGVFVQSSEQVAALVVLLWLLGVGWMLVRHVGGLRVIAKMERGPYQLLPPHWQQRVNDLRQALGIAREVAVRLSDEVLAPCAARLVRPVIWLPLSLLTRTPAKQLEALLAHELAHIARKDWLWNGVQCAVESLLFFHPAVWWLSRRIRQEREQACDDLAVAACGDPVALAEALVALERERHSSPASVLAAPGGSLLQRIRRLLSYPPSRGAWGVVAALGALAVSGVLLATPFGLAGGRPPELHVESSTAGELGPGDYREIIANGPYKLRVYRVSLDAKGKRTEVYREDGQVRSIDAGTRRWIAAASRTSAPPAPPPPPPPPAPPLRFDDTPECKALVQLIAAHRDVIAKLGTPVVATSKAVDGHILFVDADGEVDARIELRGPRGLANVRVKAKWRSGTWTVQRLDVR